MNSTRQDVITNLNESISFMNRLGALGIAVMYLFNPGAVIYFVYHEPRTQKFWDQISPFLNGNE
jgi:hypothetical protein